MDDLIPRPLTLLSLCITLHTQVGGSDLTCIFEVHIFSSLDPWRIKFELIAFLYYCHPPYPKVRLSKANFYLFYYLYKCVMVSTITYQLQHNSKCILVISPINRNILICDGSNHLLHIYHLNISCVCKLNILRVRAIK